MAYAGKFLHRIRKALPLIRYNSLEVYNSRRLLYARFEPVRKWMKGIEPELRNRGAGLLFKLNMQRGFVHNVCSSGRKLSIGQFFGLSFIFGSTGIWNRVAYAMDSYYISVGGHPEDLYDDSDIEDDPHDILRSARRFWLPVFFVLTVLMNWEHPVALTIKLILLLFSTRPSPLSVYLLAEKWCYQFMRIEPHLYMEKSLYAKKVEIQDYKLLCLAEVEVLDQKLKLLGILGGWWVLPSLTSKEAMSAFRHLAAMKYVLGEQGKIRLDPVSNLRSNHTV